MATMDAVRKARERIAMRCADPKAKLFGIDEDLRAIGEAFDRLQSQQQYIAAKLARCCMLMTGLLPGDSSAHRMLHEWEKRLIEIAGQQWS